MQVQCSSSEFLGTNKRAVIALPTSHWGKLTEIRTQAQSQEDEGNGKKAEVTPHISPTTEELRDVKSTKWIVTELKMAPPRSSTKSFIKKLS